jgi:hypothetical protein
MGSVCGYAQEAAAGAVSSHSGLLLGLLLLQTMADSVPAAAAASRAAAALPAASEATRLQQQHSWMLRLPLLLPVGLRGKQQHGQPLRLCAAAAGDVSSWCGYSQVCLSTERRQ